jgi:prefoldin subunit 5
MSESSGHRRNARKTRVGNDNLSFNSQLSGAESGDMGTPGKGRRKNSDLVTFFAGNTRSNYSMQVYLSVVIVVGMVLWFVIPAWFLFSMKSGDGDISGLEARIDLAHREISDLKLHKDEIQQMIAKLEGMGGGTSDAALLREQAQLESRLRLLEDATKLDFSNLQAQLAALEAQASNFNGLDSEVKQARSHVESLASTINSKLAGHAEKLQSHQTSINQARASIDSLQKSLYSLQVSGSSGQAAPAVEFERPNFALGCAGAKVQSTDYPHTTAWNSFSNFLYKYTDLRLDHNNPPFQALSSQNEPGQCWCFDGQQASITIKLLTKMVPDEFFIYHIFLEYYRENQIDRKTAAPKSFRVTGIGDGGSEFPLGSYEYDIYSQKTRGLKQTFLVQENSDRWVDHVRVDFEASHWEASRKYTCLYQFGVYGKGSLP